MFEVKKEILDSQEALLEIAVSEEAVQKAMETAARSISREVNIPGFRKGKAPYAVVVRYVGEPAVREEAADQWLKDTYSELLEKAEVNPFGPGELEDMTMSPLMYKIRIPLEPDVELGDYRSLREEWTEAEVSEEEIAGVLEQIQQENAIVEPVARAAQWGDEVHIDVLGVADGETVVDEEHIPAYLSEEAPFLSRDFAQALIGLSEGEERTFAAALPDTLEEPSLRGLETEFTVKVQHVYERTLPDLDDALASTVGSFETLEALKDNIRERMLQSKAQQAREAYRMKLVDALVEQSEIRYPPLAVEETLDGMIEEMRRTTRQQRQMSLEDALQLEGRTLDDYREAMRPYAEQRLRRSLVVMELARREGIEVSDDELAQEVHTLFRRLAPGREPSGMPINLDSPAVQSLRSDVYHHKALERLEQIGRGLSQPEPAIEDTEGTEVEAEA